MKAALCRSGSKGMSFRRSFEISVGVGKWNSDVVAIMTDSSRKYVAVDEVCSECRAT